MTEKSDLRDEDFILEDDDDDEINDLVKNQSSMQPSTTTDTLDSVLLETSPNENLEKLKEMSLLDQHTGVPDTSNTVGFEDMQETGPDPLGKDNLASNISSYFATDSGNEFFDSLGGPVENDDGKLGSDLFTSIAISKSEEDIRISEMNAREIKDSDAISESNLSIGDFPNLSRNQSFQSVDAVTSSENLTAQENDNNVAETEEKNESVIHIHHREHKTSTSEPEPISFEGECDPHASTENSSRDTTNMPTSQEFEEIMAQAEDIVQRPDFTSQVSSTSDTSEAQGLNTDPYKVPNLTPSAASLPDSNSSLHPTGPVVGTTPSQMSPMGTPVHQGGTAADPSSPLMNPPGFQTQSSVPSSPFHLHSQEVVAGGGSGESVFAPFGNASVTDDAFTSILSMSDADRRHDAWIPSDATSHILFTMSTPEQLSTPGILVNERQGDPVRDLVLRYMGEQEAVKRSVLTLDSVTQDVDGLKKLIEAGCLRAAIDLTGCLLEQAGQGYGKAGTVTVHTPHSLQLWFVRLTLMVKLRMYEQAEAEMRAFQTLDTPDIYFQFYPNSYPGRRGSMVSFSMRLLHAELPLLCGRSQETLDRLYYIMAVCNRIKSNLSSDLSEDGSATHMTYEARKVSLELWNQREVQVLYKIAATMLSVKDYEGALAIYSQLLEKEKNARMELQAGIGRIHLQMGNINEASRIMQEVETESSKGEGSMPCFNLLNKGLVAMCSNNFHDAYQHFKSAVQIQPHNTCAVNNMAVCSLYVGRLKDALNTLEQLVHSDPANTLHEGVLFNLCTLYELETSRALHKKQAILDLVNKHKGDGFPVACLKMA